MPYTITPMNAALIILRAASVVATVSAFAALTAAADTHRNAAPLGLSRLNAGKGGAGLLLPPEKFTVDTLSPDRALGVQQATRNGADYVPLSADSQWSRPLRGLNKQVIFVSFLIYGSQSTTIEIGGARLGITASPIPGRLQLMIDRPGKNDGKFEWRALKHHFAPDLYDGQPLAALPVLTVRLDPGAGVWDLYANKRLVAVDQPLLPVPSLDNRRFIVRAGSSGAWVCGLVQADENPLFEDANSNGIEDEFEKEQRGALLAANVGTDRAALAQQWKERQRRKAPTAWLLKSPRPDALQNRTR